MRARKRHHCERCGRRIVVMRPLAKRKIGYGSLRRASKHHDLCQRCWRSEQDRNRVSG